MTTEHPSTGTTTQRAIRLRLLAAAVALAAGTVAVLIAALYLKGVLG
jgi:hypothetical protein